MGYLFTQLARLAETTIFSVGAHLTIAVGNIFFLGITAMFAFGAYAMAIAANAEMSVELAILFSLGCTLILSTVFWLAYIKMSGDSFTVFTLSSMLAFEALVKSWDSLTGGVLGISGIMRPSYLQSLQKLVFFQLAFMVLVLIIEYIILKTSFGRALLGMRENTNIVESLGSSYKFVGSAVIVIASLMAAMAGMLAVLRIRFLDAQFGGIIILVQIVTIAIIAAKPKIRWLVGAVIFVTFIPEVLRFFPIPPTIVGHLRSLIYSVLLIVTITTISHRLIPKKRFT